MKPTHVAALALLTLLGAGGWFHHPERAATQSAPTPSKIVADWPSPQLLLRALPRSPSVVSSPSITPDGHVLLFTASQGQRGDVLLAYSFDPKSGILGDSQVVLNNQWKVEGDPRRLYSTGGGWDPIPVISPDGRKIVQSLSTGKNDPAEIQAPAYIFDRDPMTGRMVYEIDPRTGYLSEKYRLVTRADLRQLDLPNNTSPVWRNTSFSPNSRFVYVPMKVLNDLRYPFTVILQKELDPKTGGYELPTLIHPPVGWDIRSGVGVSSDGTYYLAAGQSSNPKDGLFILPNKFTNTAVRARSFKDDEVIYYMPRDPATGAAIGLPQVVRTMAKLRRTRYYDHLAPGKYPWFYHAPVAVPNSNVWLFDVEIGGENGGELQLLAATEDYFRP